MDIETDYNCGFSTQFFKVRFFCLLLFGTFDMHNALGRYFIVWYEAVNLSFSGKILAITSSPVQTGATLLDVTCCVRLHTLLHMLLDVGAQSLKPVKLFSQQLPTFLLFRDRRSVAQQCWIRLHSSSKIVGAAHAYYAWFTKTYGLYPYHDALRVPTLLGVVASVCTPLPTRTQQLPK